MARVEERGGAVEAVPYMKAALVESHRARIARIESGEQVLVGVNRFTETEPSPLVGEDGGILVVDPGVEAEAREALAAWRSARGDVSAALDELRRVAASDENIMEATLAAARAGVTTGEWAGALREVFGCYRAPTGVGEAASPAADEDLRDEVARVSEALGRTLKILVGKPGLDGHSNGAEQIAVRARDAGMDVVYEGIRLTPAQIARSAVDEGVHVIGLSILSGSHRELIPDVIAALDGADIPVVVGGIIPDADVPELKAAGVAAVYTPKDFELDRIMHEIIALVAERHSRPGLNSARGSPRATAPSRRRALNLLETRTARAEAAALVSAAGDGAGHVVGVTGPPGRGQVDAAERAAARVALARASVAVLAVDPSSKRSGGALLGDRARIEHDPADRDVFIRSMAAGERLGGLAPATRAAAQALACAFDVVVIETVGVGQSETDVAEAADTVAVVVQPGSGDALQFLKAGIMEVPDVLVVTKADLGAARPARRGGPARGAARARRPHHAGARRVLDRAGDRDRRARRRAGRAPRRRSTSSRTACACGGWARSPTSSTSTASTGCARVGGRRAARRALEAQDPRLDEPALLAFLERQLRST